MYLPNTVILFDKPTIRIHAHARTLCCSMKFSSVNVWTDWPSQFWSCIGVDSMNSWSFLFVYLVEGSLIVEWHHTRDSWITISMIIHCGNEPKFEVISVECDFSCSRWMRRCTLVRAISWRSGETMSNFFGRAMAYTPRLIVQINGTNKLHN